MSQVFLAAGHGGADSGATSQGTTEREETIRLVNEAAAFLSTQDLKGRGLAVVPHSLGLIDSINWINVNSKDPAHDLCIEVHMNAGGGHGIEVYYYDGIQSSKDFANELLAPLVKYTGLPNRGVKPDTSTRFGRLGFIRDTAPMASLTELGFIDTDDLQTERSKGGKALAAAVLNAVGSAFVEPKPVVVVPITPIETPKEPPHVPVVPPTPPATDTGYIGSTDDIKVKSNFLIRLFTKLFKILTDFVGK